MLRPLLVKLKLVEEKDYKEANQLNISVCHKFPQGVEDGDLVIAELERSNLSALDSAGLSYQIIDEEPWTGGYYLVSPREKTPEVDLSEYGKILAGSEKFYFLKISDENARRLAEKGC